MRKGIQVIIITVILHYCMSVVGKVFILGGAKGCNEVDIGNMSLETIKIRRDRAEK